MRRVGAMTDHDALVRSMAFQYVDQLSEHGDRPLTWTDLNSFTFEGSGVRLVSQQGIFKPAILDLPISIRTTFREPGELRPYEDEIDEHGYLLYRYRGMDQNHHENVWLRRTHEEGVSLLYFVGVARGLYLAHGAAIIEDHPETLTFGVQLFPIDATAVGSVSAMALDTETRRHYMSLVRRRAGQATFRESVLAAYGTKCTLCRLGHRELLDAAHIVPDSDGGASVVTNGMSMCKIHHAAYDSDIIGIRPDHVAEVKDDVLVEIDGPMLRHGLQELHGATITVPRFHGKRPSRDALEQRYVRFRNAV